MTRLLTLLCLFTVLISCKTDIKGQNTLTSSISEEKKELTVAEKIAQAHGFDNWKDVERIDFTFNIDRGENHFERIWTWKPQENQVTFSTGGDSIVVYSQSKIDSTHIKLDQGFINDKFWLLVPFQLVWDEGTTITEPIKALAPISKTEMKKITITYGNEGGYTPGDAYDIFYGEDFIIKEWIFRKGNSDEPSMTTTFENYKNFKGLTIAIDHKTTEGNFNLYFTNIKIK